MNTVQSCEGYIEVKNFETAKTLMVAEENRRDGDWTLYTIEKTGLKFPIGIVANANEARDALERRFGPLIEIEEPLKRGI